MIEQANPSTQSKTIPLNFNGFNFGMEAANFGDKYKTGT